MKQKQESTINIRKAVPQDEDAIWDIIQQVIATGDTYVFLPDSPREQMIEYWCGKGKHPYVACIDGEVVGTFVINDNFPGLGSHVANAGYMTHPGHTGKGIGRKMGEYSLTEARRLGYHAMQFNIVVKSNERSVHLWQKLGFEIIGEVPEAFRHQKNGFTNTLIMWRKV